MTPTTIRWRLTRHGCRTVYLEAFGGTLSTLSLSSREAVFPMLLTTVSTVRRPSRDPRHVSDSPGSSRSDTHSRAHPPSLSHNTWNRESCIRLLSTCNQRSSCLRGHNRPLPSQSCCATRHSKADQGDPSPSWQGTDASSKEISRPRPGNR